VLYAEKRVNERLWKSWYREMDGQLSTVLSSCTAFYSRLVDQLEASLRRPDRLADHQEGLKHALQLSLVALGDVARYEQSRRERGERRDWTEARQLYQRALEVAPSNGKVYNQLGLLAVREGKLLDGAYLYARSLVCETAFATRGNLLNVLQRGEKQSQPQQDASGEPTCEAMETYSSRVLSCLHMALAGNASKAAWSAALEQMQSALAHLLDVCDQQDEAMPIDGSLLELLSSTLTRSVCLAVVLAHNSQHALGEGSSRRAFDEAFANGTVDESIQAPLALGNATVSSLLSKLTALLSASAESTRTKYFANAVLPAVNTYLDWLHLHQALLGQRLPSAKALQGSCAELFHTLSANGFVERGLCCARKRGGGLSSCVLPEDRELSGFLPYEKALQSRLAGGLAPEKKPLELTEEERLVLRVARFMALSERYVFSGKAPVAPSLKQPARSAATPSKTASREPSRSAAQPSADPFAIDPVLAGRLCVLCSNTSTFADGVCEFCGYEDEDDAESDDGEGAEVNRPSWIQAYDVAHNNDNSSPARNAASPRSPRSTSASSSPQTGSPMSPPPQKLETDFKTIMAIGAEHDGYQDSLAADEDQQRLIVIDAPNVAMRHGKGKVFSCVGVELAVKYFEALGHRVVAFIPDYMLQSDEERAQHEKEQGEALTAPKVPDNVALLGALVHQGVLIPTPPQDYDDSYSIQYAGLHNGFVVTNDLFRDHIVNMVGPRERKVAMRAWLRAHQISYSWVRDEFLPNPSFRYD
jgi:hypothetical protein